MPARIPLIGTMAVAVVACSQPASTGAAAAPTPSVATPQASPAPATGPASSTPAAPAPRPAKVRNIDPTGIYDVELTSQGSPLTVTAKIERRSDGSFGGQVTGETIPTLPINSVKVTGNALHISVTAPDGGEAIIDLTVDGDRLSGAWSMTNDGSKVSGRKRG